MTSGQLKDDSESINPFGAVGKDIYHFNFLKFLDIKSKRNPKYFIDIK